MSFISHNNVSFVSQNNVSFINHNSVSLSLSNITYGDNSTKRIKESFVEFCTTKCNSFSVIFKKWQCYVNLLLYFITSHVSFSTIFMHCRKSVSARFL